jgi:hypothetical protein
MVSRGARARRGGLSTGFLCLAASLSVAFFAPREARADTAAELAQWTEYFWHFRDTGTPHVNAASFSFTQSGLNQPTVFPLAGALTLFNDMYASKLNQDASSCAHASIVDFMEGNSDVAADFKEYTLSKQFVTSWQDGDVSLAHLSAITTLTTGTTQYSLGGTIVVGSELIESTGLQAD